MENHAEKLESVANRLAAVAFFLRTGGIYQCEIRMGEPEIIGFSEILQGLEDEIRELADE